MAGTVDNKVTYFSIDHLIAEGWKWKNGGGLTLPLIKHDGGSRDPLLLEINLTQRKAIVHVKDRDLESAHDLELLDKEVIDIGGVASISSIALTNGQEVRVILQSSSLDLILALNIFIYGEKSESASNICHMLQALLNTCPKQSQMCNFLGSIKPNKTFFLHDALILFPNRSKTTFPKDGLSIVIEYPEGHPMARTLPCLVSITWHDATTNETRGVVVYDSSGGNLEIQGVEGRNNGWVTFWVRDSLSDEVKLKADVYPKLYRGNVVSALEGYRFV